MLRLVHPSITPCIGFCIYRLWPEFAELLATRPITSHEFHSTGKDCLKKKIFLVNFKFIMLDDKSTLYLHFPSV